MIGNDVVDLCDPETLSGAQHPRFELRAFSPVERMRWQGLPPRERHWLRWAHWAAKESTYKALRRLDSSLVFAPSRFAVVFDPFPTDRTELLCGWVRVNEYAVALRIQRGHEHLHAWACLDPLAPDQLTVASRHIAATANPRHAVRKLLREFLPSHALEGEPVILERRARVPILRAGDQSWPASLSHHGRWVAIAFHLGSGRAETPERAA